MWASQLQELLVSQPCVLVTVADIAGSAPRATGSRMVVTRENQLGSIGGGNLEFRATATARQLLGTAAAPAQHRELYGLGPELNQCCGGAVTLLFEVLPGPRVAWLERLAAAAADGRASRLVTAIDAAEPEKWVLGPGEPAPAELPAEVAAALEEESAGANVIESPTGRYLVESLGSRRKPLFLFGAGHVGRALAAALRPLPFEIFWLDSRPGRFTPEGDEHLHTLECADPAAEVSGAPPGSTYLVMTHSHQMDEDICHAVLQRGDAEWLGLIGSTTKRRRFVHRLEKRGIPRTALDTLVCPIGLPGITGKRPATIAVAVASQLLAEVVPEGWR